MSGDELELALAWLHGTAERRAWRKRPPRERHRSLYDHWCPAPPNDRCLLGGVYATPVGLLFYGLHHARITMHVAQHGSDVNENRAVSRAELLTMADLHTPRSTVVVVMDCRHGQPGDVTTEELLERATTRRTYDCE